MTPSLTYYPDSEPGIRRLRCGRGFRYVSADGDALTGVDERGRLAALAVPPAWREVWICPHPDGHLQATGVDARGRKQYLYHPDWTELRARQKYARLADFGRALPGLRRRIARDLAPDRNRPVPDDRFATAAVLALLDALALRLGSPEYAQDNGSFGATTLRRRHVRLHRGAIALEFPGKGGKPLRYRLRDRLLHRALQRMDDLPDGRVFCWADDSGAARAVLSQQVNAYLAEATGLDGATAKTFRTWQGTLAAFALATATPPEAALSPRDLAQAAAERLHNTPAIARSSYIHPDVLALSEPSERAELAGLRAHRQPGLRRGEGLLIAWLSRGEKA